MIKFDSLPPTTSNTRLTQSAMGELSTPQDFENIGWFAAKLLVDNGADREMATAIVDTVFMPQIMGDPRKEQAAHLFQNAASRAIRTSFAAEVSHV